MTSPSADPPPIDSTAAPGTGGMPRNPSRFQVNRVDQGDDSPEGRRASEEPDGAQHANGHATVSFVDDAQHPMGKQVQFSVGLGSPNDEGGGGGEESALGGNMSTVNYGTTNLKSFRNVQTLERLPHQDHYRNVMSIEGAMAVRPTLADLHEQQKVNGASGITDLRHFMGERYQSLDVEVKPSAAPRAKFGWIKGVLMRCILSILGTMLYLRVSWMTGEVGIILSGFIIALSTVVTVLTTISMCAICTNGEVKGGGAYFMISRSLGPEFGGSIGLIFSFANAVASGMCVVGFAEPLVTLLRNSNISFFDEKVNDIRLIGLITICLLLCIVMVGVSFEAKMQLILLVALTLSIIDYVVGTVIPPNRDQIGRGMTGYTWKTFAANALPPETISIAQFFGVFSVFFPACTGIMAGANISGDLADPSTAIPKGTILAIIATSLTYFGAVLCLGSTVVRHATGVPIEMFDSLNNITTFAVNETCATKCKYGLLNTFDIWELEGAWLPLILAGIFAATLSSALGALVSAPKVFQAVCKDRLFPRIEWFAKGFGKDDEPKRGYVLFFCVAFLIVCIGVLDKIALIISDCFLVCYALVNYACFDASFSGSPGFRPGFRYYNKWVALFAAIVCILIMFIIKWESALLSLALVLSLYLYILYRKPDVNWGSSSQAYSYKAALQSTLKLAVVEDHVKNYRPQILVFTGNPVARQSLVDFVASITQENSMMMCGHVVLQTPSQKVLNQVEKFSKQIYVWLTKRNIKSFYCAVVTPTLREGAQCLMQAAGVGKLKPNVVFLGMKHDWKNSSPEQILEYFNILHDAFDNNCGLGILCADTGLDFSQSMFEHQVGDTQNLQLPDAPATVGQAVEGSAANVCESYRQLSVCESASAVNMALQNLAGAAGDEVANSAIGGEVTSSENASLLPPGIKKIIVAAANEKRCDSVSSFAAKLQAADDQNELVEDDEVGDLAEVEEIGNGKLHHLEMPPSGTLQKQSTPLNEKRRRHLSKKQMEILASMNQFQTHRKRAFIDVWWLFDDGGLGLLIPHLLTLNKSYLDGAKMRVFTVSASRSQLQREQRSMAALLSRFRIDYSDVYVIPDLAKKPSQETLAEFQALLQPFRIPSATSGAGGAATNGDTPPNSGGRENDEEAQLPTATPPPPPPGEVFVTDAEYNALKGKTYRQLRTRELLLQHSRDASLIVLSLPIPRKGAVSAAMYMAWLEFLSRGLPPTLLLRGNQQSVLTFYS